MKSAEFNVNDLIVNFTELCRSKGYLKDGALPLHIEQQTPGLRQEDDVKLYPLDPPHKMINQGPLFFVAITPHNGSKNFPGFSLLNGSPIPCLFFDQCFHRWMGGLKIEIIDAIVNRGRDIRITPQGMQLVYVGQYFLGDTEADLENLTAPSNVVKEIISGAAFELFRVDDSKFPREAVEESLNQMVGSSIKIPMTRHDGMRASSKGWPITPLYPGSQVKRDIVTYFNVCGDKCLGDRYYTIAVRDYDIGREGVSPRLKWKKLGV